MADTRARLPLSSEARCGGLEGKNTAYDYLSSRWGDMSESDFGFEQDEENEEDAEEDTNQHAGEGRDVDDKSDQSVDYGSLLPDGTSHKQVTQMHPRSDRCFVFNARAANLLISPKISTYCTYLEPGHSTNSLSLLPLRWIPAHSGRSLVVVCK